MVRVWDGCVNTFVSEALCARGEAAQSVVMAERQQMMTRRVWTVVNSHSLSYTEQSRLIRSSIFSVGQWVFWLSFAAVPP